MGSDDSHIMELDDFQNLDGFQWIDDVNFGELEKLLQAEASNVPTLISSEPNNPKAARRKSYKPVEKEAIDYLRRSGVTREQAAKALGVSLSTLKRRCKEYGITYGRSDGKKNRGTANKEVQAEYTIEVEAKYGELKVRLKINSNTCFKTLRKELKDKLKVVLKTQSFLIEYEYGRDGWIMITCTDDLKMRMDELHPKEGSQRIMVLRVRNHQ